MRFLQILLFLSVTYLGAFGIDREWWKYAGIYEIYLKSFKDSDGDGIGDIKGLISKLDYLVDIGVNTVYTAPFYPSSMADGGYDITDFRGIDPIHGTMEDFELLMKEMRFRGLYFIMDLVINHSSDEHEWFQKSIDRVAPYTDYYVWVDPKGYDKNGNPIPPNNWFSIFSIRKSSSAWSWNEKRKQFYLHQCSTKQPDFNLRNEAVKRELKDMMKFWLEKGVSGFRVDAPMLLMEDNQLRDNAPLSPEATVFSMFSEGERTFNHPDTFKFLHELNVFLRNYDRKTGRPYQTAFVGETYGPIRNVVKYYGTKKFSMFHLPFNFLLQFLTKYLDARDLQDYLKTWLDKLPKGMTSNWALGNHDYGRVARVLDTEYNSILLAVTAMLPGAVQVYYGEELSMGQNHLVPLKDPYDRFFHRAPMHWDDSKNAGFTTAENPWLPVHPNYWQVNVKTQTAHENSSLHYFKDLMSLRQTDNFKYGDLKFHVISKWILAFSRTYKQSSYIIMMNLGTQTHPIDWPSDADKLSSTVTVVASSPNSEYKKGSKIELIPNYPTTALLRPHSVIILQSK